MKVEKIEIIVWKSTELFLYLIRPKRYIMEHRSPQTTLGHAEKEFLDLVQHGDDFFKIELLRPAKSWYKKALKLNIETERIKQKIAECDRLLAFEQKVIKILVAIAAVIVLVSLIF